MEIRLNKFLNEAGFCSRRAADKLIEEGKVTIDGQKATLGMKVSDGQVVRVGKKVISGKEKRVVLAFYKPMGIVCTEDRRFAGNLVDFINYPMRVTYAGRLDKDSEGLMLLSNDGELVGEITKASNFHEKEYKVRVNKPLTESFIKAMSSGVTINDEEKDIHTVTRKCEVKKTGTYTFSIVLTQGINRQIRRMCEALGYRVRGLIRTRIMHITLGDLKPGGYRELSDMEIAGFSPDL
ncbi:MAG: pseudouridine synthase [Lachnospiraceae bacterium]|jgi:23S rRNA pseudouridine2604 synthase|nr:pseudouridine synthase [Lachnospiraceae bacterium]